MKSLSPGMAVSTANWPRRYLRAEYWGEPARGIVLDWNDLRVQQVVRQHGGTPEGVVPVAWQGGGVELVPVDALEEYASVYERWRRERQSFGESPGGVFTLSLIFGLTPLLIISVLADWPLTVSALLAGGAVAALALASIFLREDIVLKVTGVAGACGVASIFLNLIAKMAQIPLVVPYVVVASLTAIALLVEWAVSALRKVFAGAQ